MTDDLEKEFNDFLSSVPATRLKQNITRLVFFFLKRECKMGLPDFMDICLTDFLLLFELLDKIDNEIDQSHLL